jgi:hypothetical protein
MSGSELAERRGHIRDAALKSAGNFRRAGTPAQFQEHLVEPDPDAIFEIVRHNALAMHIMVKSKSNVQRKANRTSPWSERKK